MSRGFLLRRINTSMLDNLMIHSVNVNRPTPTKGTSGGEKDTYATVYTNLRCMVQPVSPHWLIQYQQRRINVSHSVFTNANPTIKTGDKIAFGSRTFLVQGFTNKIELGVVMQIDVLEIV